MCAPMPPRMTGIARVIRLASDYPAVFHSWSYGDLNDVADLPLGTKVLVLHQETADYGWQCVVLVNEEPRGADRKCLMSSHAWFQKLRWSQDRCETALR